MARKKNNATATADPLEDLENEIDADLADEVDLDDLDGDDDAEGEDDQAPSKAAKALVGKTITFTNDEGNEIKGKVVEAGTTDDDGGFDPDGLVVDSGEDFYWETVVKDCKVAGKKKPAPKKKSTPKAKPAKEKAEKPAAKKGKDDAPEATERRMLPVSKIKVPKKGKKPREVNKEGPRFKRLLADMKKRGQTDSLKIQDWNKPILVGGEHRLEAAKELGWEFIECQLAGTEDDDDRLYVGLLDNETRKQMTWIEIGRTVATLTTGGKYSARKIARSLQINESQLSRMVTAVGSKGLPKKFYAFAENKDVDPGDEKRVSYAMSVFLELPGCEKTVQDRVYDLMKDGKACTLQDLRNIKKEDKKARKEAGEDVGEDKPSTSKGEQGSTYRSLTSAEIGDWLKVKVTGDELVLQMTVEWPKKTFRGFDPIEELKEALNTVYADGETSIDSIEGFRKVLGRLKKELA